jgi:hypothetical protein
MNPRFFTWHARFRSRRNYLSDNLLDIAKYLLVENLTDVPHMYLDEVFLKGFFNE